MKKYKLLHGIWIPLVLLMIGINPARAQLSRIDMATYTTDKAAYLDKKDIIVGKKTITWSGTKMMMAGAWFKINGTPPQGSNNRFLLFKYRFTFGTSQRVRSALYYWEDASQLVFQYVQTTAIAGANLVKNTTPNEPSRGANYSAEPLESEYTEFRVNKSDYNYQSDGWNYFSMGHQFNGFSISLNGKEVRPYSKLVIGLNKKEYSWGDGSKHYLDEDNHNFYDMCFGDSRYQYYIDDIALYTGEVRCLDKSGWVHGLGYSIPKDYGFYTAENTRTLFQYAQTSMYYRTLYYDFEDGAKNEADKVNMASDPLGTTVNNDIIDAINASLQSQFFQTLTAYKVAPKVTHEYIDGCKIRVNLNSYEAGHYSITKLRIKGTNLDQTADFHTGTPAYAEFSIPNQTVLSGDYIIYDYTNGNQIGLLNLNTEKFKETSSYSVSSEANKIKVNVNIPDLVCMPKVEIFRNGTKVYTYTIDQYKSTVEFTYEDTPPIGANYDYTVKATVNGKVYDINKSGTGTVSISNVAITAFVNDVILNEETGKPAVKLSWTMAGDNIENNFEMWKEGKKMTDIEIINSPANPKEFYMIDKTSFSTDKAYAYELKYVKANLSKLQTVKLLSGIPQETFNISRDENRKETAALSWTTPTFTNQTPAVEFTKFASGKTASTIWFSDFYNQSAQKYTASILARYISGSALFSFPALGVTATYDSGNKRVKIEFENANGTIINNDIDLDLTTEQLGQPYPKWNMFTFIYDRGAMKVYINYNLLYTGKIDNMITPTSDFFKITSSTIDVKQVQIWNMTLSTDNITKMIGGTYLETMSPQPVMYYEFNSLDAGEFRNIIANSYPNMSTTSVTHTDIKSETMQIASFDFIGYNIYLGQEWVKAIAVSDADFKAGAGFDYNYTKGIPCKETTYSIAPVFAGGVGKKNEIKLTIEPKYKINNVQATDAVYQNKVRISWDETPSVANYYVYRDNEKLVEVGKDDLKYVDFEAIPGIYHKYVIQGVSDCSKSDINDHDAQDVGFIFPLGNISGTVKSPNGNPVMDVFVETDTIFGSSLQNATLTLPVEILNKKSLFQEATAVSFWAKGDVIITSVFAGGASKGFTLTNSFTTNGGYKFEAKKPDGTNATQYIISSLPKNSGWRHYLFINDGGPKDKMYIDGFLVDFSGYVNETGLLVQNATSYKIEAKGAIDELSIWNKIPYEATINGKNFRDFKGYQSFIYGDSEAEKAKFNNIIHSALSGKENGLIAYYRFDEREILDPNNKQTYNQAQYIFDKYENNIPITFTGDNSKYVANCSMLKNSTFTDERGIYELANVNFNNVDGYLFAVSASKTTESLVHNITPKFLDAKINTSTRHRDGVAFTDNSLYPVSGKVYYHQFIKDAEYPKGVVSLFNAEILVDGKQQRPAVLTAQDGTFTAEVEPGMHIFTMKPFERTIAQNNSAVVNITTSTDIDEQSAKDSVEIKTSIAVENFMVPAEDKLTARYKSNITADRKGYKLIVDDFNLWAEVNFEDSASYELEVTFKGRCNFEVGAYNVILESTDGKFKHKVENNNEIKTIIKNLPPLEYKVTLESHNKLEIDPKTVDLQKGNNSVEFIHRNPLQVQVRKMDKPFNDKATFDKATAHTGLPYVFVNENNVSKEMFIAKKGDQILMYVDVFEEYNSKRCPVDSAVVKIVNNLGAGGEIITDTMYIPAKAGDAIWSDTQLGIATVGDPNIAGEMLKDIQVSVTDNAGRNLTKKFDVFVVGSVRTNNTFATVPHTIPLMWLVDPPGDKSFSYIEAGKEISKSSEISVELSADVKFGTELKMAPKIQTVIGLGLVPGPEIGVDMQPVIENTSSTTVNHTSTWTTKFEVSASFNERIQTSDDDAIVGADADVFVGLGINYIFGEGKTTSFDWSNKKKNDVQASVVMSSDEIQTMYIYNRSTIENQVIENNQSLLDFYNSFTSDKIDKTKSYSKLNTVTGKTEEYTGQELLNKLSYYNRSLESWKEILTWYDFEDYENKFMNQDANADDNFDNIWDIWKDEANDISEARDFENLSLDSYTSNSKYIELLHQNISFGYGSNYSADINLSSSREESYVMGFGLEIEIESKGGFEANETGTFVTNGLVGKTNSNTTWVANQSSTAAVGVSLGDDDPGDLFSVSIYKDNKRGTLYFKTEGGQSSCPWEQKTQAREAVSVAAINVVDNIPYDQPAYVELELQNKSQTDEEGSYYIMQNLATNSGGLKFNVNGADMGGNLLPITLPAGTGVIKTTLMAQRTRTDIFDYEPITFTIQSQCGDDRAEGEVSPSKDIDIEFKWNKPCLSALKIFEKNSSTLLNTSPDGKQFTPSFYVDPIRKDLNSVTKFQVQIAGAETNDWTGIDGLLIEENSSTHSFANVLAEKEYDKLVWNGGAYADGLYKIRVKAECKDGTVGASNSLPLRIARNRTVLLGVPQPVDRMLGNNDQISALFSNPLSCGDIVDWKLIGNFPGSRYPVFAQSLYFDGGDHIVLDPAFTKELEFMNKNEFMLTAWIKPMVDGKEQTIVSMLKDNKGMRLAINSTNQLVFEMKNGTETKTAISANTITKGEWQFVYGKLSTGTSGKNMQVGINQVNTDVQATIANADFDIGNTGKVILGQATEATNDASPYFGFIDDVRIFGKDGFNDAITKKTELISGGDIRKYWRLDDAESLKMPTALTSQPKLTTDIPAWQYLVDDYTETLNNIVTLACYENELAFVLPNDLHRRKQLENIQIDVIFNSVYDIYKNKAYEDARVHNDSTKIKWSFMVNRNSMKWEIPDLDIVKYTGETKTFTMDLWNNGGENEEFNLLSLPDWLQAEPITGTIMPGGKKTITFTVLPTANQGLYKDEVYAENNEGWEPLLINLHVICTQPQWEVTPTNYDQSMIVTSKLEGITLDNTIIEEYAIAAFNGNEIVGIGSVKKTENGEYNTVLTVYDNSDITATKLIEIHLWDPLKCMEKIAETKIQFEANGSYTGVINFSNKAVREYQLVNGWNWISCNLTADATSNTENIGELSKVISSPNISVIRQIKHNDKYANIAGGFSGDLQTLSNQSGYLVKAVAPVIMRISAQEMNVNQASINLNKGWNLISYLPNGSQKLANVFLGMNLNDGDIVKSHTQYAIYKKDEGWFGDLEYMETGKAYYVKVANENLSLKYQDVQYTKLPKKRGGVSNEPFWQFDANKYMSTMTVTAKVSHRGNELLATNYQVGAFVNGECRGVAQATAANNQIAFYISVHGDANGEKINFKLVDLFTGEVSDIIETFTNIPNEIVGYPTPVLLTTAGEEENTTDIFDDTNEANAQMLAIYPNPFNDELNIGFSVTETQNVSIELYTVQGKFVGKLYEGKATANEKQTFTLNTAKAVGKQLSVGVYMCVLRLADGTMQSKQIIRK